MSIIRYHWFIYQKLNIRVCFHTGRNSSAKTFGHYLLIPNTYDVIFQWNLGEILRNTHATFLLTNQQIIKHINMSSSMNESEWLVHFICSGKALKWTAKLSCLENFKAKLKKQTIVFSSTDHFWDSVLFWFHKSQTSGKITSKIYII